MCQSGGKLWSNYYQVNSTNEYIEQLSTYVGKPRDLLVVSVTSGPNESRGTWAHPQIAIHCAMWVSAVFGVAVTAHVLEAMREEYQQEIVRANEAKQVLDSKVNELCGQMRLLQVEKEVIEDAGQTGIIAIVNMESTVENTRTVVKSVCGAFSRLLKREGLNTPEELIRMVEMVFDMKIETLKKPVNMKRLSAVYIESGLLYKYSKLLFNKMRLEYNASLEEYDEEGELIINGTTLPMIKDTCDWRPCELYTFMVRAKRFIVWERENQGFACTNKWIDYVLERCPDQNELE